MISVNAIAAAILVLAPWLSAPVRHGYAATIRRESLEAHVDPLDIVAHIHHESRWNVAAVSRNGEDLGLGQIRARFMPGCRNDADPVSQPSESCAITKAQLLSPTLAIRTLAHAVATWRATCRKLTGHAETRHVWAGLAGVRGGLTCGQRRIKGRWRDGRVARPVREVMQLRARLGRFAKR